MSLLARGLPLLTGAQNLASDRMLTQSSGLELELPNPAKSIHLSPTDGLTLSDGSFVWKSEHSQQRSGSHRGRRSGGFDFTPNAIFAVLCIRTDEGWTPICHSPRESMGYQLNCDLAKASSVRCRKLPNAIQ